MTAEEFLIKLNEKEGNIDKLYYDSYVRKAMIEFAKYHVQETLKVVSEKVSIKLNENNIIIIDRESILNSYPLENIK